MCSGNFGHGIINKIHVWSLLPTIFSHVKSTGSRRSNIPYSIHGSWKGMFLLSNLIFIPRAIHSNHNWITISLPCEFEDCGVFKRSSLRAHTSSLLSRKTGRSHSWIPGVPPTDGRRLWVLVLTMRIESTGPSWEGWKGRSCDFCGCCLGNSLRTRVVMHWCFSYKKICSLRLQVFFDWRNFFFVRIYFVKKGGRFI